MQLAPKKKRVIDRKHEYARERERSVIGTAQWEQSRSANRNGNQHCNRDNKPDSNKRNRRQIAQTEFDGKPGRTPDPAERQPGDRNTPIGFRGCVHSRATIARRFEFVKTRLALVAEQFRVSVRRESKRDCEAEGSSAGS